MARGEGRGGEGSKEPPLQILDPPLDSITTGLCDISKVIADWHDLRIPQRPSIARSNGQLNPRCS